MVFRYSLYQKTNILIIVFAFIIFSCKKDDLKRQAKVETNSVSEITATTAKATGNIIDLGNGITDYGHCWSVISKPTISDSTTSFGIALMTGTYTSELKNLDLRKTYHVRAYVKSGIQVLYGAELNFTTHGIIDIDGNIYDTVTIGTQVWLLENLKVTKYNDGTVIPLITDNTVWSNFSTSGYCWYNNNETTYKKNYGALYNWYAVNFSKLCPMGWHVPTDAEWTVLTDYLGGENISGGKLKETGTVHWSSPNEGVTNLSNFTALPGGSRNTDGTFCCIGNGCLLWSITENDAADSWIRDLGYSYNNVHRGYINKHYGSSVRCLRDN